jgi:KDO2-lipid IV(A) lauroyltransferase
LLKYLLFWFVFRVLGLLPLPALYFIADIVGLVSYRLAARSRASVLDNLRHAMPDASPSRLRQVAKRVFSNVGYYYADLAHMRHMDAQRFVDERLTYFGIDERLRPTLATGRGAIMLSAHFGNPELVGQAMGPLGIPTFAVTELVQPPRLSKMLNEIRSRQGVEFRPVSVGSAKHIMQTLRSGGTVALMGDRDIEGPRMRLPFFGVETWMPTGPIEVGLRTGAAIFPSFCVRHGRYKLEAYLEEEIVIERTGDLQADVRTAMLKYIERLEWWLHKEPEQWGVLERIWDDTTTDLRSIPPGQETASAANR